MILSRKRDQLFMYTLAAKILDGTLVEITRHEELQDAVNLAAKLNAQWQRKYIIRDDHGAAIELEGESGQR